MGALSYAPALIAAGGLEVDHFLLSGGWSLREQLAVAGWVAALGLLYLRSSRRKTAGVGLVARPGWGGATLRFACGGVAAAGLWIFTDFLRGDNFLGDLWAILRTGDEVALQGLALVGGGWAGWAVALSELFRLPWSARHQRRGEPTVPTVPPDRDPITALLSATAVLGHDIVKEPKRQPQRAWVGGERVPVPQRESSYPAAVRIAGIIWIAYGGLSLLGGLALVVWSLVVWNFGPANAVGFIPLLCFFGVLGAGSFGAVFLYFGVGAVRGTIPNTLIPGLASIFFGLFPLVAAISTFLNGTDQAGARQMQTVRVDAALIEYLIFLLFGIGGLVAAGVLALVGRSKYLAWRQAREG